MLKRVICDIILFAGFFLLPWYVTAGFVIIFMILFPWFLEGVIIALFFDALYSIPNARIYGHFGIFTAIALILFLLFTSLKKKLRCFA